VAEVAPSALDAGSGSAVTNCKLGGVGFAAANRVVFCAVGASGEAKVVGALGDMLVKAGSEIVAALGKVFE
jgi:hypothetical protein